MSRCLTLIFSAQVRGGRLAFSVPTSHLLRIQPTDHIIINLILCFAEKGGDPELIRESQRRRFADVSLVDKVLELDAKWRESEF